MEVVDRIHEIDADYENDEAMAIEDDDDGIEFQEEGDDAMEFDEEGVEDGSQLVQPNHPHQRDVLEGNLVVEVNGLLQDGAVIGNHLGLPGLDNYDNAAREWVQLSEDDDGMAKCLFCDRSIKITKASYKQHEMTYIRLKNEILEMGNPDNLFLHPNPNFARNVARLELKIVAFLVENDLLFLLIEKLVPFQKSPFPNDIDAARIRLGRTKAKALVCNVIAPAEVRRMVKDLKRFRFGMGFDRLGDRQGCHVMGIYT
ncbi:hypothetical protein QAD02_021357 [Eretmocerus hayati]|uniref:Uncharacterized protein n=1 Tax=Eretmocerus hayati TaxID=131215 RepID=A0ACC2PSJ5_9HYME|nr:hypothetical protein QAD02_021357 [Eretmocerus hayati]